MNNYLWLLRREFWENRAIWIVPSAIGVALTLAALFGQIDIGGLASPERHRAIGGMVLFAFGLTFFAVMNLYATWYLLDCLYSDRKDRSVLFWKSLPVSDTETVLAKLLTGLIVIPLVYFLAADLATILMAFIVSVRFHAVFGGAMWQPDVWLQLQALWLYLIVTTAIWYLPFAGWLLVVSAWARRAVMLWSVLPPLAVYLLERWFFGTRMFGAALVSRTVGYPTHAFHDSSEHGAWMPGVGNDMLPTPASVWRLLDPLGFMSSSATWIGFAVGIAFIIAAIQLRARRTEL